MTDKTMRNPGVHFPPPLLFVLGLALAWLVDRQYPLAVLPDSLRIISLVGGWSLIGLALVTITWAITTFTVADTGIYPNQPATAVVARGPYKFSRNPMYVGMAALSLGVALVVNSLWMVAVLPVVIWLLTALVIRREEAYLSSAFGETYAEYCRSVRRWI